MFLLATVVGSAASAVQRSCVMVRLTSVLLLVAGRLFAHYKVIKTASGPVLRLKYHDGKVVDTPLFAGWQGVMVGTTVLDVQLTEYGCRIKVVSGPIRFFASSMVW